MSKFNRIAAAAGTRLSRAYEAVPPATWGSTVFLLAVGTGLGLVLPIGLAHPFDWLFHGVYFALLTVSLSGFFQGRALPALAVAIVIAAAGEAAQGLLPYREMSGWDFAAGLVGALSAAGVLSIKIPVSFPAEELGFIERERAARATPAE